MSKKKPIALVGLLQNVGIRAGLAQSIANACDYLDWHGDGSDGVAGALWAWCLEHEKRAYDQGREDNQLRLWGIDRQLWDDPTPEEEMQ